MRSDISIHTDLKDDELIQLVQTGNESAFTELMSRYSPRIWKVIIANSRQRRDAEEILMDAWKDARKHFFTPFYRKIRKYVHIPR